MSKKYMGIRDIAKLAGVSVATVSRVINGTGKTSDAVRERVNEIVKEYNYTPSLAARALYSDSSKSIALFVLDLDNPFFVSLVKALNKTAFENGYMMLICNTENNVDKEIEYLKYCDGIRTKGIIFTEGHSDNIFSESAHQTLVFHDRNVSDQFSSVKSNNFQGIQLLVDYLYNLDHRKIAFAGFRNYARSSIERKEAFVSCLEAKGITVNPEYIFPGDLTDKTGVDSLDYFISISDRPTAVVCANDMIATGFINRAANLGLRIPDDFSVTGFDDCYSKYFYPKITTIRQDVDLLAKRLFECAVASKGEIRHFEIDVSMSIGNSCKKLV